LPLRPAYSIALDASGYAVAAAFSDGWYSPHQSLAETTGQCAFFASAVGCGA
jgi:hypothetical protein